MKNRKLLLLFLLPLWVLLYINLDKVSNFITYNIIGMTKGEKLSEAIFFFIYEVPKIFMLLILVIFGVGIIRSFFSAEKTKKYLEGKPLFIGNILASLLGIVTPFCTCSAIPLFLGFVEAGIPIGITFSFLIAAPMINEVALVLLLGLFGWKVALIYLFTGLFIAILAGWIIGKLKLEKWVEKWVFEVKVGSQNNDQKLNWQERIDYALNTVGEIVKKVWLYIILGIAVGAYAHGFIPEDYLAGLMSESNWYSVPLSILIGVPLYSNAAGIIPIISVLIEKGVPLGTALAFMMSVIGLSLPEIIILKKVLKWQLIGVFVGVVALGIIIVGYTFNWLLF